MVNCSSSVCVVCIYFLSICMQVCGAFLSMYDNDRRLADHFGGKLHIGFVTIREKIKLLEVYSFAPCVSVGTSMCVVCSG